MKKGKTRKRKNTVLLSIDGGEGGERPSLRTTSKGAEFREGGQGRGLCGGRKKRGGGRWDQKGGFGGEKKRGQDKHPQKAKKGERKGKASKKAWT